MARSWPRYSGWWLGIILGVVEFLLGAWAIASPTRQLLLLINLVGFYMLFYGISEIFAGFALRSRRDDRSVAAAYDAGVEVLERAILDPLTQRLGRHVESAPTPSASLRNRNSCMPARSRA